MPTTTGSAYVVLEGTDTLVAWGFIEPQNKDLAVLKARFEGLWERYQPALLVVERDFESRRGKAAHERSALAEAVAAERSRSIIKVSRAQVRTHFAGRAVTKDEITKVLIEDFPELRSWAPRRLLDAEDPRMKLFTALSFAITAVVPLHATF